MTRMTMKREIEDIQELLKKRTTSPIQFSLYATLITEYRFAPSKSFIPTLDMELWREHNMRLSRDIRHLTEWCRTCAKSLVARTKTLDKILDKATEKKRALSAKERSMTCAFMRELDMLLLGLKFLDKKGFRETILEEAVMAFECVEWFCENVPDMDDLCRTYLFGTDPSYTRDSSKLRSMMAGAMDDAFLEMMSRDIKGNEEFQIRLSKLLRRIGNMFDNTAAGLGLDIKWADQVQEQKSCFEEDANLFGLLLEMDNSVEVDAESFVVAAMCYMVATAVEIFEDEMDKTDPVIALTGEVWQTLEHSLLETFAGNLNKAEVI